MKKDKKSIIDDIYRMSEESVERLSDIMTEKDFKKGSIIIEGGKKEKNLYFISNGAVRAYIETKERETTFWIGTEGSAIVSLKSYISDETGYETVECIENCTMFIVEQKKLKELFLEDINIANWGRRFAENEILKTEEKLIPMLSTTASERYTNLLNKHPDLLKRIPLEHLATYLGITPVSLSRIRAKIFLNKP